jgi:hypothetical protein
MQRTCRKPKEIAEDELYEAAFRCLFRQSLIGNLDLVDLLLYTGML